MNTRAIYGILLSLYMSLRACDVTLVGPVKFADGLGRGIIGFAEHLHTELSINIVPTYGSLEDIPLSVRSIIADKKNKSPSKVVILFDVLWNQFRSPVDTLQQAFIKIAYSMIESTTIPYIWVHLLNTKFDAVVVPDNCFISLYKNAGVKIPIFVVPWGLYLDEFLNKSLKIKAKSPFVFGMSGGFFAGHKNHELLIDAFWQEFGNNKDVNLILHGRRGDSQLEKKIAQKIQQLKASTIKFINKDLNRQEYVEYMTSLDCYVLLSKGEGFSVTPREALALSIPCIISNNSAHKTICATGFVKAVDTPIKEVFYFASFNGPCGYGFSPSLSDVRQALRDVYNNYSVYLLKARQGKEWVKQYRYQELKIYYKTLVKPDVIMLGNINMIEPGMLTTNSKVLYEKYCATYPHLST